MPSPCRAVAVAAVVAGGIPGRGRGAVAGRPRGWLGRLARFRPCCLRQGTHQQVGIGGDRQVDGRGPEGILGPAVAQRGVRRAGDDPRRGGMAVAGRGGQGPGQVGPVEAQDQVRGPDQLGGGGGQEDTGRVRVQRVRGREDRAVLQVGEHQRPVPFGQGDAAIPVPLVAACAAEQEQRPARLAEIVQRGPDRFRVRSVRPRRPVAVNVGDGGRRGQRLLLQAHVEADVDRRGRRRPGDRVRLGERVKRRLDRGGLVVPLDVRADQRALVGRGVDPVDPGPPPGRVHRAGGPDDQHRERGRTRRCRWPWSRASGRRCCGPPRPSAARSPWRSRGRSRPRAPRAGRRASADRGCRCSSPGCRAARGNSNRGRARGSAGRGG